MISDYETSLTCHVKFPEYTNVMIESRDKIFIYVMTSFTSKQKSQLFVARNMYCYTPKKLSQISPIKVQISLISSDYVITIYNELLKLSQLGSLLLSINQLEHPILIISGNN